MGWGATVFFVLGRVDLQQPASQLAPFVGKQIEPLALQ
jgi:hypothetical protein